MEVCYSASGELVVSLPADVVEGKPVKWIKGSIAAAIGMSRHRLRLFLHEALLGDAYTFTCAYGPLVVQLVILPFVTQHATASSSSSDGVEIRLQELRSSAVTRGREWPQDALANISVMELRKMAHARNVGTCRSTANIPSMCHFAKLHYRNVCQGILTVSGP